ncbi:MAG: ABC transporter permease [Chloroflexi bacterium]|nr:ABC transporter permease [Chloroflexota bacterium]
MMDTATMDQKTSWRVRAGEPFRLLTSNRLGLLGLGIIVLFGLLAAAHPVLMHTVWNRHTYDPVTGFAGGLNPASPSAKHLLGTDQLGRDVLSQLMYSARWEFALGIVAALVTVTLGTLIGATAAYFGGFVDGLLMRLADLVVMMPTLTLLVVLGVVTPGGLNIWKLAIALGLISGLGATAIVLKAQALAMTKRTYIDAAKATGGSDRHIIASHLIPNLMPLAFLSMMFTVTAAIFAEGALAYFGLVHERMSWGIMIHTAQSGGYLLSGTRYWWLLIPAGLSISLLCGSFYLTGRALDEVVNPRLRRQR